jgi:predicted phage-related endonuclease
MNDTKLTSFPIVPIVINPINQDHWLECKAEDISSTEVSALFNCSPYLTKFELFYTKKDKHIIEIVDNNRMKWGRRLEDVIAQGFAEDNGLIIRKKSEYIRHFLVNRMAASFDYEIIGVNLIIPGNIYQQAFKDKGNGLLEIKKVDYIIYRDQWDKEEAPLHIEFQVQQQMEVSNLEWCAICPLVAGNELKDFIRFRDKNMGAGLITSILNFYDDIAKNEPPKPDYKKDAEYIISLYKKAGIEILLPTEEQENIINKLCADYKTQALVDAEAENTKKIIKAQILEIAKDAVKIQTSQYSINLGEVKSSPGKVITMDMVGTIIDARNGYRMCKITKKKERNVTKYS